MNVGQAAETTTAETTTDETTTGPSVPADEGCANPRAIQIFLGTENQLTPEFEITGQTFRISFDIVEVTDPDGFPQLEADVLDESGNPIGQGFLTFEEDGSENIIAGPGTFSLDIRANDVSYEITVEHCVGTDQNPLAADNNPDDPGDVNDQDDVMDDTTPSKPLPNTGGIPLFLGAGVILASVTLLSTRILRP